MLYKVLIIYVKLRKYKAVCVWCVQAFDNPLCLPIK